MTNLNFLSFDLICCDLFLSGMPYAGHLVGGIAYKIKNNKLGGMRVICYAVPYLLYYYYESFFKVNPYTVCRVSEGTSIYDLPL